MFELFYHPIYTYGIDKDSTFLRERYRLTKEKLKDQNILINFQEPDLAKINDIILGHDEKFVKSFINGLLSQKGNKKDRSSAME